MENINNYENVKTYKYTTKFLQSKNIHLKNLSFSFWEDIELSNDFYSQGICFTEKYLLISSYSMDKNTLGKVMIYEKNTGEFCLALEMDAKSHLGGIAFDGKNIWVCNSAKMSIERISYDFICNSIKNHCGKTIDIRNMVELYPVNLIPSCITFYDDKLWIATHSKLTNSQMMSYIFDDKENRLSFDSIYHIPSKVQGVAFHENGSVVLSTSYGRKQSSYIKIYDSVQEMSKNVDKYTKTVEMPPCSEGISIENKKLYVVFESAGKKYLEGTDGKGKSTAPLDKILIIDLA